MYGRYRNLMTFLLIAGDFILLTASGFFSWRFTAGYLGRAAPARPGGFVLAAAAFIATLYLTDLYDIEARFRGLRCALKTVVAVVAGSAVLAAVYYLFPGLKPGRAEFLVCGALAGVLAYCWRLVFDGLRRRGVERQKRLLIVGAGWAGKTIYETVKDKETYSVTGFVDEDPLKWGTRNSPQVLGGCEVLRREAAEGRVDDIVIAITHLKSAELLRCALACKMDGIQVHEMATFYEELTGKVPVEHVNDFWFVSTPISGIRRSFYNLKVKRAIDLTVLMGVFAVSLPVTLATALAIKLDSPGPVFYRQKRVGLNGEVFDLVKFRSMRVDAEKDGEVWAQMKDPRVTGVGRVIRKLRIDEIPQLWNVLKGEMSFIGPRPERPSFVSMLSNNIPYYTLRHSVKPGITGWAQINYPYGASEKDALEKLQYDFYYIKNVSPFLDSNILLKTVKVVLFGRGAR
jgi:sugar transferase (PEP-CTERM system associated)